MITRGRICLLTAAVLIAASACGLTSGSPMVDDVEPGTIGRGRPLEGAELTVTSKEFTEGLVLGAIMGIAFEASGAKVLDRTGIQGSVGTRAAVENGDADAAYEYTGTAWITYLGNSKPIPDPRQQWRAVRDADARKGLTWLAPAPMNNTYALATNQATYRKYRTTTLSDVAKLSKSDPGAVTLCVEGEFANRADGLPGLEKAYGMSLPARNITQMDTGIIYTQTAKGACTYGEVFTTDGRIRSMHLVVMGDDRKFFPNYNAAPMIRTATLEKWPAIAAVLDPITRKLDNSVARELNAKVDVDGEDPHQVALDWLKGRGSSRRGEVRRGEGRGLAVGTPSGLAKKLMQKTRCKGSFATLPLDVCPSPTPKNAGSTTSTPAPCAGWPTPCVCSCWTPCASADPPPRPNSPSGWASRAAPPATTCASWRRTASWWTPRSTARAGSAGGRPPMRG